MTSIEQSYPRLYPKLAILAVGLFAVATNGFVIAGTILRTAGGFRLKNENGRTLGNFDSIERALEGLYAVV